MTISAYASDFGKIANDYGKTEESSFLKILYGLRQMVTFGTKAMMGIPKKNPILSKISGHSSVFIKTGNSNTSVEAVFGGRGTRVNYTNESDFKKSSHQIFTKISRPKIVERKNVLLSK